MRRSLPCKVGAEKRTFSDGRTHLDSENLGLVDDKPWNPLIESKHPWMTLDLGMQMKVTGLIVQGKITLYKV